MCDIKAEFAPEEDGTNRGQATMICPVCRKRVKEQAVEPYFEDGSDRTVELCPQCREDFEADESVQLTADVLDAGTFQTLLKWAVETMEPSPQPVGLDAVTAAQVAAILGGDAWQSGGGIWLVMIHRPDGVVVAVSDELVAEYAGDEAFERNQPTTVIRIH